MIDTSKVINKLTDIMEFGGRIRIEGLTQLEANYIKSRVDGAEGYKALIFNPYSDRPFSADNQNAYVNAYNCKLIMLFCEGCKANERTLSISELIKL